MSALSPMPGAPVDDVLAALVAPPVAGDLLAAVQLEWDAIETVGAPAPDDLPRPWIPTSCPASGLQDEVAAWLHDYVDWLNDQHAWDPDDRIPPCWPRHPHLVHDLAILADQHRRASAAVTSTSLETWTRILLPAFHDRRRHTVRQHCITEHRRVLVSD